MKQIGKITLKKIPKSELKKLTEEEELLKDIIEHEENLFDDDEEVTTREFKNCHSDE
jgi:hypothetical protein